MQSISTLLLILLPATALASSMGYPPEIGINNCQYDCFCHADQSPLCCAGVVGGVTDHCTEMSLGDAQSFVQCCDTTYSCRQRMGCPEFGEVDGGWGKGGMNGEVDLR